MDPQVYLALATALDDFITDINAALNDHSLAQKQEHLKKIATDVISLNEHSLQVLKSHDSEIEDVGAIIQDVLNQPISNGSPKETTTMLRSSTHASDLAHVMTSYIKHTHATQRLIQELELLSDELKQHAA